MLRSLGKILIVTRGNLKFKPFHGSVHTFFVALDSIESRDRHMLASVNAGDHWSYKMERQMSPLEYTCELTGICGPMNLAVGLSSGYSAGNDS